MQSLGEAPRLTCRLLCLSQSKCRALSPWTRLCGFAFEKNMVWANKERINHCIWVISSSSETQVDFPLCLIWTWILSHSGMSHCPLDTVNEMDRAPSEWQISPWSKEMELKSRSSFVCWTRQDHSLDQHRHRAVSPDCTEWPKGPLQVHHSWERWRMLDIGLDWGLWWSVYTQEWSCVLYLFSHIWS